MVVTSQLAIVKFGNFTIIASSEVVRVQNWNCYQLTVNIISVISQVVWLAPLVYLYVCKLGHWIGLKAHPSPIYSVEETSCFLYNYLRLLSLRQKHPKKGTINERKTFVPPPPFVLEWWQDTETIFLFNGLSADTPVVFHHCRFLLLPCKGLMILPFTIKWGNMNLMQLLVILWRKESPLLLHGIMVVMKWLWKDPGIIGHQGNSCPFFLLLGRQVLACCSSQVWIHLHIIESIAHRRYFHTNFIKW